MAPLGEAPSAHLAPRHLNGASPRGAICTPRSTSFEWRLLERRHLHTSLHVTSHVTCNTNGASTRGAICAATSPHTSRASPTHLTSPTRTIFLFVKSKSLVHGVLKATNVTRRGREKKTFESFRAQGDGNEPREQGNQEEVLRKRNQVLQKLTTILKTEKIGWERTVCKPLPMDKISLVKVKSLPYSPQVTTMLAPGRAPCPRMRSFSRSWDRLEARQCEWGAENPNLKVFCKRRRGNAMSIPAHGVTHVCLGQGLREHVVRTPPQPNKVTTSFTYELGSKPYLHVVETPSKSLDDTASQRRVTVHKDQNFIKLLKTFGDLSGIPIGPNAT
ncbi:hypothetical protein Sjap_000934 [Stephania japonica]|uniref:Uncharacterized protein n=1 Tax=Stephania japonica TaxID=461633 RepID=A0AAP0KKT4_9MAGN